MKNSLRCCMSTLIITGSLLFGINTGAFHTSSDLKNSGKDFVNVTDGLEKDANINDVLSFNNDLYVANGVNGLWEKTANSKKFVEIKDGLPDTNFQITKIYKDWQNNLYLGTNGEGLWEKMASANEWVKIVDSNIEEDAHITSIFEDQNNNLWIGTKGEGLLVRIAGEKPFNKVDNGFPEITFITTAIFENNGYIWVGLKDTGLFKGQIAETPDHSINFSKVYNGLADYSSILSVGQNKNSDLLLGVAGSGLYQKTRGEKDEFKLVESSLISKTNVTNIFNDLNGNLWIGTTENGLFEQVANKNNFVQVTSGLLENTKIQAINSMDSHIYVGTSSGLYFGSLSNGSAHLSGGQIAGIVIGVIAGAGLIAGGSFYYWYFLRKRPIQN